MYFAYYDWLIFISPLPSIRSLFTRRGISYECSGAPPRHAIPRRMQGRSMSPIGQPASHSRMLHFIATLIRDVDEFDFD